MVEILAKERQQSISSLRDNTTCEECRSTPSTVSQSDANTTHTDRQTPACPEYSTPTSVHTSFTSTSRFHRQHRETFQIHSEFGILWKLDLFCRAVETFSDCQYQWIPLSPVVPTVEVTLVYEEASNTDDSNSSL
ncbi:hypothetical protein CBL_05965 [Carabus blaptoides fortunei]